MSDRSTASEFQVLPEGELKTFYKLMLIKDQLQGLAKKLNNIKEFKEECQKLNKVVEDLNARVSQIEIEYNSDK